MTFADNAIETCTNTKSANVKFNNLIVEDLLTSNNSWQQDYFSYWSC